MDHMPKTGDRQTKSSDAIRKKDTSMHSTTLYSRLMTIALAVIVFPLAAHAQYFSFQSTFGHYLQAYTNGVTHASNDSRGDEETWIVLKADTSRGTYAIKNARTGQYLSYQEGGCFRANRDRIGPWEQFLFEDAGNGWLHIRSARTDYPALIGTNQAKNDTSCGGEVKGDQGSLEWTVKSHATAADSGGGVDIVKVLSTAAEVAKVVTTVASAF
jgi:hypothetical protein